MRRPQFSIRTLLWLTLVAAAFFGGAAWQRQMDGPYAILERLQHTPEEMTLRDGTIWIRVHDPHSVRNTLTLPDGTIWIRVPEPAD